MQRIESTHLRFQPTLYPPWILNALKGLGHEFEILVMSVIHPGRTSQLRRCIMTTWQHWTFFHGQTASGSRRRMFPLSPSESTKTGHPKVANEMEVFLPNARVRLTRTCEKGLSGMENTLGQTQDWSWTCCTINGYELLLGV